MSNDIYSWTRTTLSVADFNAALSLLNSNDRTGMYVLLAQATGNPPYMG
jgi:hypothetical protein